MSEYQLAADTPLEEWDSIQVAEYLKSKDLGDYSEMFIENNVTGAVAHRLDNKSLAEIGVQKVGDRLQVMQALETLKKARKLQEREKVIWTGVENQYFSCYDENCATCCGCIPDIPSEYTIKANTLEIKTQYPNMCGPVKCCYGHSWEIDNIDISEIRDIDLKLVAPSCFLGICCCGDPIVTVIIKTDKETILKLEEGQGEEVQLKIKNQVEAMQILERS